MSIVEKDVVSLNFYQPIYKEQLADYRLHDEQQIFSAMPLVALEQCEKDEERHPVLIFWGSRIAGFFVLHGWEGVKQFSDNKDAMLLRAYSIDESMQGKGVANHSMRLLPMFVKEHFSETKEIILAVNHANFIAQHVYRKAGFIDTGVRSMGRAGEMFILKKQIK